MVNKKISISLPEELLKSINELSRQLSLTRSELIARILEEKLEMLTAGKNHKYPTVLWKLSTTGLLKLRSPRFLGRTLKGKWIVEEVET
ncbi:ribbon-helix-helix protein, CopG family [Candidatus Bathyarchaeota archaeon]|nr:ribbon-helix-helix protein, CopG family [Candidatus Bathyarchaeota archaeon]MBS7612654.1 ribbon-helix-helix protein, CopG family [Candidatus Bathyarchaeota archaeon]MBS7617237.1 ribbon-helix-helix protein, CopG family [Candidatus Bathyarchaeota archaeon]